MGFINFKIAHHLYALKLQLFLKSLGYDAKRDGNSVVVAKEATQEAKNFLNDLEADFSVFKIDDYDEEIINPYEEYGVNERDFY